MTHWMFENEVKATLFCNYAMSKGHRLRVVILDVNSGAWFPTPLNPFNVAAQIDSIPIKFKIGPEEGEVESRPIRPGRKRKRASG